MTDVWPVAPRRREVDVPALGGGLLAVHAHPDDETLSTGALLATWAASGRPVTVVTCTRGEQGEVIPADLAHLADDPVALAAHRENELAAALAALGVTRSVFLDQVRRGGSFRAVGARFTDSGMEWAGPGQAMEAGSRPTGAFVDVQLDEAAARVAAVIGATRPDVVVGYEPGGGYGHPDHVRAHRVMRRAVERAARRGSSPYRVPVVLWAVTDVAALRAGRAEVVADGSLAPTDPDGPVPSSAVDSSVVDVRVDVGPVLERVAAALAAHATQVQGVRTWPSKEGAASVGRFALSNAVMEPVLRWECYRVDPEWPPTPVVWPDGVDVGIA